MTSQLLVPIAGTFAAYLLLQLAKFLYEELTSPLRHLPGPTGTNLVLGHFRQIEMDSAITSKWRDEFGPNFQWRGLLNKRGLYTTDTKALNHILVNDYLYQKGPVAKKIVTHFLGNGLLAVEMDEHKRQRKILNPAFGVPQIRELTEVFNEKSAQLRDIWMRQIAEDSGSARIDVLVWLRKMTLDVIGQAGKSWIETYPSFNYQFNAMEAKGEPNELDEALTHLFHSPQAQRQAALRFVQAAIPILGIFPTPGGKLINQARRKMDEIANQLLTESKAAVRAGGGEKAGRDLLSIMVEANMSSEIPEHRKLSDADVIAQVPTFFVAGHETTSTATAWALHALSMNRSAQTKLREELLGLPSDNPTMDALNSLPYLEKVVRETMRVHSPVGFTIRMAMDDDVIPLSKQYVDRRGKVYDSITVRRGTVIRIPIAAVHSDKDIWGDDAAEFRPDRWDHIPEATNTIPGVWGNLLTFLAGPHNCIGFRFSLVEMKSLLFALIRAFEFEMAVPEGGIGFTTTPVLRPTVLSEPEKGSQLPLIVRPYLASQN
ncbi:cytochrome P450 [Mycena rosella]|uniref:Cytochrome P450 n=1 Tax=Mycena rosella TaxID=1033263 RepID=A0AAD7F931_MYCRO|nr:cytochrome P450 [Mycena rosella]